MAGFAGALGVLVASAGATAQPAGATAQPATTVAPFIAPLTLAEVLSSARQNAPLVLEALARVRGAEGRRLSADAAFDTVFSADAEQRLSGYYDGGIVETRVTQPLGNLGGYAYGGYRVSRGEFPIYEDERFTNKLGELKAGAVFALMRDRMIDERRFGRIAADADVALADADRLMVAIGVQARAIQAYNNWVVAGLRLQIYRDLLKLSQDRQQGFVRQVETGARPRITLIENEQNLLRRETLVVQSEQALDIAATALSLYLRGPDGQPVRPLSSRLPADLAAPLPLPAQPRAMVLQRPDLRSIDIRMQQAGQRLALDRNAFLPRLDLKVEASHDFGEVGLGGPSRSGTETKVGLAFTLPLQRSAARGRLAQTRAEIDAFEQRRRQAEDQILADIDALGITATSSARLNRLAADEADRAAAMATGERRRFQLGASDFFLVNVREEAAADAKVRRLDAAFRQIVAHADLAAATADITALGL
ncbi:multidrug transporter [Polymorphobacter glacialis]|uniref:Multidrug transporter n=1 Tax=Sandarakinorhabdus glacialis TaxID=1614636 RepID=A0A917E5B9_9SPHN|nr:TolC family protein [Polymorphobacter glacialis]GGE02271.1 multidrug transporter [Polymorphobacter glacialis]